MSQSITNYPNTEIPFFVKQTQT
uniref:Uncharacterized protein n=1 Tax=Anguilla anguilla TaxID=7936 RepID=A0A0E9XNX7_ANGAN